MPIRASFTKWLRRHIRYRKQSVVEIDLSPLFEQLESGHTASVEVLLPLSDEALAKLAKEGAD